MLNDIIKEYFTHCYYIASVNIFWPKFKSGCPYPIFHFDCNKNIKFTPTDEAQSAHFSFISHCSLHPYVLQDNENGIATNQFVITCLMIHHTIA